MKINQIFKMREQLFEYIPCAVVKAGQMARVRIISYLPDVSHTSVCAQVPLQHTFECVGMFVWTYPVQTAPAVTRTQQNKASSDSSASGTAVELR